MVGKKDGLPSVDRWLMVEAAKRGAKDAAYTLTRVPGRGLSNVWYMEKPGEQRQQASIRTTLDRGIAFPPLKGGTEWKTLDDVAMVVVAAVDSKENPQRIEVYIIPANDVRKHFDEAYAARTKAGHAIKDD